MMFGRFVSSELAALLALSAGSQTAPHLQEGSASHHFDGNFPPSTQIISVQETLIGRCRATADMFSGRRNPVWPLSARALTALRASISRGAAAGPVPQARPGLGYRGVAIACSHRPGS